MIFLDTNVVIHAVGRPHQLREQARELLADAAENSLALVTSAEVFQELLHVFLRAGRTEVLDEAWHTLSAAVVDVWPVEMADLELARSLRVRFPNLQSRDLLHLASCMRRDVRSIYTFDGALRAAMKRA